MAKLNKLLGNGFKIHKAITKQGEQGIMIEDKKRDIFYALHRDDSGWWMDICWSSGESPDRMLLQEDPADTNAITESFIGLVKSIGEVVATMKNEEWKYMRVGDIALLNPKMRKI
jgi:hypothetical protein